MELNTVNTLPLTHDETIDQKSLNKYQYTSSLLEEGIRSGILTSGNVVDIQIKIMSLLKDLIMRYTRGESTSVTVETTESLLNSLMYCLDFYMLKIDDPLWALKELKEKDLRKIYDEGQEQLKDYVTDTKRLYGRVRKDRLKVGLEAYNATIDEGIPAFFQKYNIVFEAHNAMASIDYPLAFDDMRVRGISYIRNYLEHLSIETEFCRYFHENDIEKTLRGFGRMCRLNHSIELINIFELIMNNCIFSVLCGNKAGQLCITKEQSHMIVSKLQQNGPSEINNAAKTLISYLHIYNPLLIDYINNYKELFLQRIISALKNNSLNSLIVTEEEVQEKFTVSFDKGDRMNQKGFESVVKKLLSAPQIGDKIDIIQSNIHSLQDFIDILNSDCLFGEEFEQIFSTLGHIELTILAKIVFYEELRDDMTGLSELINNKRTVEAEWQEHFIKFVSNLSESGKQRLEDLLDQVDYEELKFY